ncbi:hypothetical protein ACFL10_00635 [Patescibacteria group bacterium]
MERKKGFTNLALGLSLIAGIASPGCASTEKGKTTTSNKPAAARKANVARIRTVLGPTIYNCFGLRKERDQTAESRCSKKAKIKKYREKGGSYCFGCREEKEIIE